MVDLTKGDQKDILTTVEVKSEDQLDVQDVEVADLLSSTPSPLPPSKDTLKLEAEKKDTLLDLSEFEILENNEKTSVSLTSNVAILAGEFSKPVEEEEDDFDAAFDALGIVFWSIHKLRKHDFAHKQP